MTVANPILQLVASFLDEPDIVRGVAFNDGQDTSSAVQIDHVFPLSDA